MIISHKRKFIFIKTTKTAGTSIEIALSKYCGKHDIIGPMTPEDNEIRKGLGYPCTQNHLNGLFWEHMSAEEIINLIGIDVWEEYYSFCFERHPYERVISQYWHYMMQRPEDERMPISAFIESGAPYLLTKRGFELYTISGRLAVNTVYFYERLDKALKMLADRLGTGELVLPQAKTRFRKDYRNPNEVLTERDRRILSIYFAREFATWDFDNPPICAEGVCI